MNGITVVCAEDVIRSENLFAGTFPNEWLKGRTTKKRLLSSVAETTTHDMISDVITSIVISSPVLLLKIERAKEEKNEETRLTFSDVFGEEL